MPPQKKVKRLLESTERGPVTTNAWDLPFGPESTLKKLLLGGWNDRVNNGSTQLAQAYTRSSAMSAPRVEAQPHQFGDHVSIQGGTIRTTPQPIYSCMRHQRRVTRHTLAPCLCTDWHVVRSDHVRGNGHGKAKRMTGLP
ncbi:hypothetical protein GW17_00048688 [Ensete ventricosum]|nr:hypothetical protein GW17_00048688 [Ensete ventricosum]